MNFEPEEANLENQGNEVDKKGKIPFGAMAVRLGYATPEQVLQALEEQRMRKSRGKKHVLLGLLMIKLGIITAGQMRQVMKNFNEMEALSSDDAIHLAVRIRSAFTESHKIILFTSAVEQEGVSRLTSQISNALALMEQGDVLLIDANFRSPTLHARIRGNGKPKDSGPKLFLVYPISLRRKSVWSRRFILQNFQTYLFFR